ncbi:MAG: alpha/beta fold hydrolase [Pseudomonadota bacterium]
MHRQTVFSLGVVGGLMAAAGPAAACSQSTPCAIEGGEYYIALPEPTDTPPPAILYIHGYGGSPKSALDNERIMAPFLDRGYAVIAPQGLPFPGGTVSGWSFHPDYDKRRDEVSFLQAVRDEAAARHELDPERVILTGFSIGGSMTSYLACAAPDAFSAYAPLGGSFWREHPKECEGPVRLMHTHGWRDGTVPLEGRNVRGGAIGDPQGFSQGDVFQAMEIWRETNGCIYGKADSFETNGPFWRRKWERCDDGAALEFALFPGGHIVPEGWADMMLDWYEGL